MFARPCASCGRRTQTDRRLGPVGCFSQTHAAGVVQWRAAHHTSWVGATRADVALRNVGESGGGRGKTRAQMARQWTSAACVRQHAAAAHATALAGARVAIARVAAPCCARRSRWACGWLGAVARWMCARWRLPSGRVKVECCGRGERERERASERASGAHNESEFLPALLQPDRLPTG